MSVCLKKASRQTVYTQYNHHESIGILGWDCLKHSTDYYDVVDETLANAYLVIRYLIANLLFLPTP